MSREFPEIPEVVWDEMCDAMLNPDLAVNGAPHPSGRPVRRRVLERALRAAQRRGLTMVHESRTVQIGVDPILENAIFGGVGR